MYVQSTVLLHAHSIFWRLPTVVSIHARLREKRNVEFTQVQQAPTLTLLLPGSSGASSRAAVLPLVPRNRILLHPLPTADTLQQSCTSWRCVLSRGYSTSSLLHLGFLMHVHVCIHSSTRHRSEQSWIPTRGLETLCPYGTGGVPMTMLDIAFPSPSPALPLAHQLPLTPLGSGPTTHAASTSRSLKRAP